MGECPLPEPPALRRLLLSWKRSLMHGGDGSRGCGISGEEEEEEEEEDESDGSGSGPGATSERVAAGFGSARALLLVEELRSHASELVNHGADHHEAHPGQV